jgi:hypothetical protein
VKICFPQYYSQDWYSLLFNRMISTLKGPDDYIRFRNNKVRFITFNYDRSFEYFLHDSFIHAFFEKLGEYLNKQEYEEILKQIPYPIIHVYGKVDEIELHGGGVYKNDNYSFDAIERLSKNIHVIGEERQNSSKEEIPNLFTEYKRIFFLGFGYAGENLEALDIPEVLNSKHKIYGTAQGKTESEIKI